MAAIPNNLEQFTPEQIAYWIREIRPRLAAMQEQSMERTRQQAQTRIGLPAEAFAARTFRFGEFDEHAAQDINLHVVTVTTHDDPETGQPGSVHTRKLALYVPGKPYLMLLPEDFTGGEPDPEAVVFLTEVQTVTVHEKGATPAGGWAPL